MFFAFYVAVVLLAALTVAGRRIDGVSVAIVASIVYFWPLVFPEYPISEEIYLYCSFCLLALVVTSKVLAGRTLRPRDAVLEKGQVHLPLVAGAAVVSSFFVLGGFFQARGEGEGGGVLYYFFAISSSFLLVVSYLERRLGWTALSVFFLLLITVNGDRTQAVIGVLSVMLALGATHSKGVLALLRARPLGGFALVGLAVAIGLFGKVLYGATGDFLGGAEFLGALQNRWDAGKAAGFWFEPYHTQRIFQYAVEGGDRVDPAYLELVPVQILPFAEMLGGDVHVQSNLIKEMYFSDWSDSSGVSGNFFAEGYLLFGPVGVVLGVLVYCSGLVFLRFAELRSTSGCSKAAVYIATAYWAFYLHRSSVLQIIGHEKRVFYFWLAIALLGVIVTALMSRIESVRTGR